MAKTFLKALSPLNGAELKYEGLEIRELTNIKLLSIAAKEAHRARVSVGLAKLCGLTWPEITHSTQAGDSYCLGLQTEQIFLFSQHSDHDHAALANALSEYAAVTDQSDSWVVVEINGENVHSVMERLCPIDLTVHSFALGQVARTAMGHLSVIVFRRSQAFVMLSPRSTADDFLHNLKQTAEYAL